MRSMRQTPAKGDNGLHIDAGEVLEPGDTDWPNYRITDLRFDCSGLLQKMEAMTLRAQTTTQLAMQRSLSEEASPVEHDGTGLPWPPGFAGHVARYIHQTSFMPVKETAIVATLGLLAGVCGRAYSTYTKADLALYLILVAAIGSGKDAIHEGIPMMLDLSPKREAKYQFLQHTEFVSGQALHTAILETPGFLNLEGEFGKKLKRMANPLDSPMQHFRTTLLNAYNKTEFQGRRSMSEDSTRSGVRYPALSFLGETTPGTFYEALTSDMMDDGFLSRFTVIFTESEDREPNSEDMRSVPLDNPSLAYWRALVDYALQHGTDRDLPTRIPVLPTGDAEEKLEGIRRGYDAEMRGQGDAERHLLVRAHLKVLKIASLLAVADNYLFPKVDIGHVAWARRLVETDIQRFRSRKQAGDVGSDDHARERKLSSIFSDYLLNPVPPGYKVPEAMRQASVVPRSYLQIRTQRLAPFNNHRSGASRALEDTIQTMIANGYLMEIDKLKVADAYGPQGRCYRIVKLPK